MSVTPSPSPPAAPITWLLFDVGTQCCAVDSRLVRQILAPPAVHRLPGSSVELPGLLEWRGRAVGVLDLGASLGKRPSLGRAGARVLISDASAQVLALVVDAVRGFRREDAALRIPVGAGLPPPWNAMLALLPLAAQPDAEVCALLDLPRLCAACLLPSGRRGADPEFPAEIRP